MITLREVAIELERILNGTSENVPNGAVRPFDGVFLVKTQGFHLDHVMDKKTKSNFFPVFIDSGTGEFNPIQGLEQVDYSFPVSIYFPIRYKDKMLEMQKYLVDCFVGASMNFNVLKPNGELDYKQGAVTNISACELGEITDMDVDQYGQSVLKNLNKYISEQYMIPVGNMEPWISMDFTLFVSTMKNANQEGGYVYGNAIKFSLNAIYRKSQDVTLDYTEEIKSSGIGLTYTASTASQQGFDLATGKVDKESSSLVTTNARGMTFEATIENNDFWRLVLSHYSDGTLKDVQFILTVEPKDESVLNGFFVSMDVIMNSFEMHVQLGTPLTATFALVKKGKASNVG